MIDTVFFDWGGVIADDPGDDFLKDILRSLGASEEQVSEIGKKYMRQFMRGQMSEQDYWRAVESDYGFTIPVSAESVFLQWQGLVTNPNVLQLVYDIKRSGRQVALLSNVITPTYEILKDSGAYEPFDVVIASCDVGYAKPDPEIYLLALSRASAKPEASLFIDDKQHNLDAASAIGMQTILAKNPAQYIAETRELLNLSAAHKL